MNLRNVIFLFALTATFPAYGSTFGDEEFPFQHDNLGTSSSSDCDERVTKVYDEPNRWKNSIKNVNKEAFAFECEGIKTEEGARVEYARSTVLRVSMYFRSKLRWLIRRMGSDYALPLFVKCYVPDELSEVERARLEDLKVAFPHSTAGLVRMLTNSYVTSYICGKRFPSATLVNLITIKTPEFATRRDLPKDLFNDDMPVFVKQFMPQLKEADYLLTDPSEEAYTWLLFAYEKACIYFMQDFAKALVEHREKPAVLRAPFQGLAVQTIAQLYMAVKPQFKKGYKPREDPTTSTNGFHLSRLELREKMRMGIVPTMGDIQVWGVTIYALEPADAAPDEPGADDEHVSSGKEGEGSEQGSDKEEVFSNSFAWDDTSE